MKALSIRQPWASLIVSGSKDIENRSWPTKVRGRVLIHAAKGITRDEYFNAAAVALSINRSLWFPTFEELNRGGIIGSVEIVDCVTESKSPWFFGDYGFVLRDPQILPFVPMKGRLGFFEVDESMLNSHG